MRESFLTGAPPNATLVNERTGALVASTVELAVTSETRRKGLLGRTGLDPLAALIIAPCSSIHMFFMQFPIDAVFVDRSGVVLKIVSDLKPWRIAGALRAHAVLELHAGAAGRAGLTVGDRVALHT